MLYSIRQNKTCYFCHYHYYYTISTLGGRPRETLRIISTTKIILHQSYLFILLLFLSLHDQSLFPFRNPFPFLRFLIFIIFDSL